jgi:hypothetical protein
MSRNTIFMQICRFEKAALVICLLLVSRLAYSLSLEMEAIHSSEISVNFYQTTWFHIPEDSIVHSYCFVRALSTYFVTVSL